MGEPAPVQQSLISPPEAYGVGRHGRSCFTKRALGAGIIRASRAAGVTGVLAATVSDARHPDST
jgi:hypothetical protein